MKKIFGLLILILLASCSNNTRSFDKISDGVFFSGKDSVFTIKTASDYGWKYFDFQIKNDELRMYSDSLYDYDCGLNIEYPHDFYNANLGRFRNRSNCSFKQTGNSKDGKYEYIINLKDYTSPPFHDNFKTIKFYYNGDNFIYIDSMMVRKYFRILENKIYYFNQDSSKENRLIISK